MIDLNALASECELEFYDCETASENGKTIYRVFVTKTGGVSLDDCEKLSRILSPIFDVEPPVSGEYFLEVSSPGLERKLSKTEHFSKSIGELVKITTSEKDKICGKILKFELSVVVIDKSPVAVVKTVDLHLISAKGVP